MQYSNASASLPHSVLNTGGIHFPFSFQVVLMVNATAGCNSTTKYIMFNTSGTNITLTDVGPCPLLIGLDTLENYTAVLATARQVLCDLVRQRMLL